MREHALSLRGSRLVQIWFVFPDFTTRVPNSCDVGGPTAHLTDIDGDGRPELLGFGPQAQGVHVLRPPACPPARGRWPVTPASRQVRELARRLPPRGMHRIRDVEQ